MKRVALVSAIILGAVIGVIALTRSDDTKAVGEASPVASEPPKQVPAPAPKRFGEMTQDQRRELRQDFGEKFQACLAAKMATTGSETDESAARAECLVIIRQELGMID